MYDNYPKILWNSKKFYSVLRRIPIPFTGTNDNGILNGGIKYD